MAITRRDFLGKGALLVAAGLTAPSFLARTAIALDQHASSVDTSTRNKILVAIQLSGGNDGLNTLIPFADSGYYQVRSSLAIPIDQVLPLTDTVGLHPRLGPFQSLYQAGTLAVVQGVGYPNPNRSHFRSMDIWHTARPDTFERTGWLGRYLDGCQCGHDGPLPAVSAGDQLNSMFYTDTTLVPAIASVGAFALRTSTGDQNDRQRQIQMLRNIYNQAGYWSPYEALIRKSTLNALDASDQLQRAADGYHSPVEYPADNPLASQLQMVAQIIAGNLGTRLFSVQLSGFDTHAAQANQQPNLLGQLGEAVEAFSRDLAAMGRQDDVLMMTFSEFGRRVAQNGSNGTDHGTAEPMFFIGSSVVGGLHGTYPSLEDLDDNGDLKFSTDFRSVYAAVLRNHLGVDPKPVLAGEYAPVDVLRPS